MNDRVHLPSGGAPDDSVTPLLSQCAMTSRRARCGGKSSGPALVSFDPCLARRRVGIELHAQPTDVSDGTAGPFDQCVVTLSVRDEREKREKNPKTLKLNTQPLFAGHRHRGDS